MAIHRRADTLPDEYLSVLNAFRLLVFSAVSYGASGDSKSATNLIVLSFRLADRLGTANCGLEDYLSNLAVTGLTDCLRPVYEKASFPTQSCAEILKVFPPLRTDLDCPAAIRTDFYSQVLPSLTSDLPKTTGAGTYNAVKTAKTAAETALSTIANVQKPFSEVNNSALDDLELDANVVLKLMDQDKFQGPYKGQKLREKWQEILDQVAPGKPSTPESDRLRESLNKIHNSLGRMKLLNCSYQNLPLYICGYRLTRDFARIYLASRIYRGTHGGKLPDSTAGFVPILGSWPNDPFDGKPYIYQPKEQKVHGVRENLVIDRSGDIYNGHTVRADEEISLRLKD